MKMRLKLIKILILVLLAPLSLYAWKMESGTVNLPSTLPGNVGWTTVTLQQNYTDPVVFAMPTEAPGYSGSVPAALRVKNVTSTSFDIVQLAGTASADTNSTHAAMSVSYFVIEKGQHSLNGVKIEAGSIDTSKQQHGSGVSGTKGWDSVNFTSLFSATPALLTMVQTINNQSGLDPDTVSSPWLVSAVKNLEAGSFDVALERAEVARGDITTDETIAYVAVDANVAGSIRDTLTCQSIDYETMLTSDTIRGWDNGCYSFNYSNTYSGNPNVIGSQDERDGNNGGWLRQCSISATDIGLTIDEDIYKDSERSHNSNIAGLVIFAEDFVYDSSKLMEGNEAAINYREDECYWLGTPIADMSDSSATAADAIAMNGASTFDRTGAFTGLCKGGDFTGDHYADVDTPFALGSDWSLSVWLEFPFITNGHGTQYYILGSYSGTGDLPVFELSGTDWLWGVYDNSGNYSTTDFNDTLSGWHHLAFVNTAGETKLYLDGNYHSSIALTTSGDVATLYTSTDDKDGQTISAKTDEYKFWSQALTIDEITLIYQNESTGKDYTGTTRTCPTCDATIAASTWELVGIPADFRNANNPKPTVGDIFSTMSGAIGTDWRLYKRTYNSGDNGSGYVQLGCGDNLVFGIGYWLGSKQDNNWSANGAAQVDYNSTSTGCTADRCVEFSLVPVTHDYDDGTGPYRYNMSGFIGTSPVEWADCRFIVDGTVMTPSELEAQDIGSKQIWLYNPSDSGANGNGYTTCDDTTPGGCKLIPYKGFWIELHESSMGKSIKLLIPQE